MTECTVTHWDRGSSREAIELAALLTGYHLQTEAEKGLPVTSLDALPRKYLTEITDPHTAFAGLQVLIARYDGHAAGCLVITTRADSQLEIKRLWTDPKYRGRHVASALLQAAHGHAVRVGAEAITLSVWEWRADAIALYTKVGFTQASTWEDRDHLICMIRPVHRTATHGEAPSP